MITHKEHIIKYFKSGIRDTKEFKIGIEHEKFLFDKKQIKELIIQQYLKCFKLYMNLVGSLF